jgi:hypothetical protein
MPAVATINSNNSSYTIVDTVGGATIKNTYPLSATSSFYVQDAGGNKTLYLMCNGQMVIAVASSPTNQFFGNSIFGSTNPDTAQTAVEANVGAAKGGGVGSGAKVGNLKSAFLTTDHDGWILLNGRAVNTLTTSQQTAWATLGIAGSNLPDATNRVLLQGTIGAQIGSSSISQANLPNISLAVSTSSAGTPAGSISSDSAGTPAGSTSNTSAGTPAGSIDTQGAHTHSQTEKYRTNAIGSGSFWGVDPGATTVFTGNSTGSAGSHNHNFTGSALPGHTHSLSMSALPAHTHTFTGSALPGHTHSVSLGGSGAAYTPAAIGVNHFLFLGA